MKLGWSLAVGLLLVSIAAGSFVRARQIQNSVASFTPRRFAPDPIEDVFASKQARPYCFDSKAAVLLTSGEDGFPGRAFEDDDLDGEIDDRSEMGAVPSDDRCLSPADVGYAEASQRPETMVVSRGAYVECDAEQDGEADRVLRPDGWYVGGKSQ
ncbi:hypothetical protein LOC67_13100 [Stieleria sp. JC731]|uniref:hypothetical protein n=1 Tax=Pirellulaceae TaxID=2691357 RepID=UPI001E357D83|nr:hypothetical protein [Stieleria sp. JC731]MCC9601487.1 hypothetical protein [Stieleria sp. JC731]